MIALHAIFLILFLFVGFLAVRLIMGRRRWIGPLSNRRFDQIAPHFRPVDIVELTDILNIAEEGYLRLNLTPQQFRGEQRGRMLLAIEYFGRMSHNVMLLYEWGSDTFLRSSRSFNREEHQASRELIDLCRMFRTVAWRPRLKLRLWLFRIRFLPFTPVPLLGGVRAVRRVDLIYTYEQIRAAASVLCQLSGRNVEHQLSSAL